MSEKENLNEDQGGGSALNDTLEHGRLQIMTDHIAERLDELADLTEIWKRHREAGRNPKHTRSAILQIAREMTVMVDAGMTVSTRAV